jgi:hypothetical protein
MSTRKKVIKGEVAFSGESVVQFRHLSLQLAQAQKFMEGWGPETIGEVMQKNRKAMEGESDWVQAWVNLRTLFFDDSLRITNGRARLDRGVERLIRRLNADVWKEFLLQDSAVVFWMENGEGTLPKPIVLDGEACDYSNGLGGERLTVKLRKHKLQDYEKQGMDERWVRAYEQEGKITLDADKGEHFRVLTRAKMTQGLGMPRLKAVYRLLGNLEGLQIADTSGATWHRDVIQHITAGHEIRNGDLAGRPDHFITKQIKDAIEKAMKTLRGAFRNVSNFDVNFAYVFLDPKFFDASKYDGTLRQLDRWGGAGMLLLVTAQPSPFLLTTFGAEGRRDRQMVGDFLTDIVTDPTFLPGRKLDRLKLSWNPHSFRDAKTMVEAVRMSLGEGLASRRTGREMMSLDHEEEGDRLEDELKKPERNRPGFEPKQGMLNGDQGGRPPTVPGDA